MSHQLTELRQTITEKDEEIEKLNEMLEEAGETFAEKETELSRLHRLISTHEEKIKEQGKSISDLEEALRESQLALNTADRRLTKQEEDATTQNEAKAKLQGTKAKSQSTRVKHTAPFFPDLDLASTSQNKNVVLRPSTELMSRLNPSKRVLQLIVTPLQNKIMAHHTRTSLLRLKNSPAKDPTRGRECLNNNRDVEKENPKRQKIVKRKLVDDNDTSLSKRRRVSLKKGRLSGNKNFRRRSSGRKYNLRSKRF